MLIFHAKNLAGWMDGWVDGWMEVKARLRIAYSNQKYFKSNKSWWSSSLEPQFHGSLVMLKVEGSNPALAVLFFRARFEQERFYTECVHVESQTLTFGRGPRQLTEIAILCFKAFVSASLAGAMQKYI